MGIDASMLPDLLRSADIAGKISAPAASALGLLEGTPVVTGGGDGVCACVGAGVVAEGQVYNVIGSSSWISMASRAPVYDPDIRTFNWAHMDPNLYAPCGTMQSAGYSLKWAKNELCRDDIERASSRGVSAYALIDEMIAETPPGANGLIFLPYLMGERSPRWNPEAKGCFIGLNANSSKYDMLRSVLEGVGYNLKVILDIFMEQITAEEITVIGGGAKSAVWPQILADIWRKRLSVPLYLEEATAMGAAVCGGVGVGAFKDFSAVKRFIKPDRTVCPRAEYAETYEDMYRIFNRSYDQLVSVFEDLDQFQKRINKPIQKVHLPV